MQLESTSLWSSLYGSQRITRYYIIPEERLIGLPLSISRSCVDTNMAACRQCYAVLW
uniref:Uncharacterized protein n=1 Tax=Rhodnius prolixus TaxID=13249 RepID=T1HM98_RHOPR